MRGTKRPLSFKHTSASLSAHFLGKLYLQKEYQVESPNIFTLKNGPDFLPTPSLNFGQLDFGFFGWTHTGD